LSGGLRALLLTAAVALLPARPARAYAWMVSRGYTGCATCHVDPSGAGVLTPYGRAQGEIILQSRYGKAPAEPSPSSGFLWNVLRLPDWLLGGGAVRYLGLATKIADAPTTGDRILMQADLAAAVQAGGLRASASLGVVSTNGTPASISGNVVSREHWLGYSFDDGAWLVRAGRINIPFGIRSVEHTLYVRQTTRSDLNDTQQHGVAVAYTGELLRGEIMGIAGNYQTSPDAFRERGYSGYLELTPTPRLGAGVSSRITHAADDVTFRVPDTRQMHGLFVRASPWTPLALLAEADFLVESPSGGPASRGLATMLQADLEPWQGVHFTATGETLDLGHDGISLGGWLTATWFFAPHLDIRADLMDRSQVVGTQRIRVFAYMAQGHVYF
jgi:hypothetical protein